MTDDTYPEDRPDPIDDGDRDGGELEDASVEAMERWASRYDELDGAPENDGDR